MWPDDPRDRSNVLRHCLLHQDVHLVHLPSVWYVLLSLVFCYPSPRQIATYPNKELTSLAVSETFRSLCQVTVILHTIFFGICLVVTLCQCRPLEKMWDLTGTVEGSCINTTAFFYCMSPETPHLPPLSLLAAPSHLCYSN